jgi:hypothetical protein
MKPSNVVIVMLVACGGGKPAPKAPPPPPKPAPEKVETAPEPAPPPVPKVLHAKAALAPVKGSKVGTASVSFAQDDGGDTTVTSDDFDGLKPGKYHLVIHDGEACDKPGDAWKGGAAIELTVKITKDTHSLEETKVKLDLGGVAPAAGHALVLHDDKKGKPGKALSCGAIEGIGGASD